MTAPDHIGLADELVDAAGLGRMRAKTLVPGAQRVALDVAERLISHRYNELIYIRMIEIAAHQRVLLARLSPPAYNFRRFEPAPDHRKIGRGHWAEDVSRRHRSAALQRLDGQIAVGIDANVCGDIERAA